jgi:hypothetical protein
VEALANKSLTMRKTMALEIEGVIQNDARVDHCVSCLRLF